MLPEIISTNKHKSISFGLVAQALQMNFYNVMSDVG